jgi:four helix bundle protein
LCFAHSLKPPSRPRLSAFLSGISSFSFSLQPFSFFFQFSAFQPFSFSLQPFSFFFQFSAFQHFSFSLQPFSFFFQFSAFQHFSFSLQPFSFSLQLFSLTMRLSEELRKRTRQYASAIIRCYVLLPKDREEVRVLGKQLLRSGTSVAAHGREASRARSDSEFCSKLDGLLQEADESQLWLELLRDDCSIQNEPINHLLCETDELLAIFTSIVSKLRKREA